MQKQAVLFFGPPGAGKDTQANILQDMYGFTHVQSSKLIELALKNGDPNDPVIRREQAIYDARDLNTEEWVISVVGSRIHEVAQSDENLVTSGSLRKLIEAKALLPLLEQCYGRNGITVIQLLVSRGTATSRNAARRVCEAHKHPIPATPETARWTVCPEDGSLLESRKLDNTQAKRDRAVDQYEQLTLPALEFIRSQGYEIFEVDAERSTEEIAADVAGILKRVAEARGASAT